MTISEKNITILGAGIGGLTAAIALAQRGARVRVLEQAPELTEVGAGLQITPNGSAVLVALGLADPLAAIGLPLKAVQLRDYQYGRSVMRLDMTHPAHGNPNPYLMIHRADLIEVLADGARAAGVDLCFGRQVVSVAVQPERCDLQMADGTQEQAEILVAADGVRSLVRQELNGAGGPAFTGQAAWRATVPADRVPGISLDHVATVYMGPGRHLVTYPLRGGRLINIVAVEARSDWVAEGWHLTDDPKHMRAAFAGWSRDVQMLLNAVEEVHLWGLFAHPVAPVWASGAAVLLGDACHPTLPFLAQGANMAIEDAWVLAEELDRQPTRNAGFAAYQTRRSTRVKRIVAQAHGNTAIYHMATPGVRQVLHFGMRVVNVLAAPKFARRYDWLYGLDVTRQRPAG